MGALHDADSHDPIRTEFAKANGVIYTDLAMMAGVATICEECQGKRFQASVLENQLGGKDISEVLAMPVAGAEAFFGAGEVKNPAAHKILGRLVVGHNTRPVDAPVTSGSPTQAEALQAFLDSSAGAPLDVPSLPRPYHEYRVVSDGSYRFEHFTNWNEHFSISVTRSSPGWAVTSWVHQVC